VHIRKNVVSSQYKERTLIITLDRVSISAGVPSELFPIALNLSSDPATELPKHLLFLSVHLVENAGILSTTKMKSTAQTDPMASEEWKVIEDPTFVQEGQQTSTLINNSMHGDVEVIFDDDIEWR
jgi:hypothetical protein